MLLSVVVNGYIDQFSITKHSDILRVMLRMDWLYGADSLNPEIGRHVRYWIDRVDGDYDLSNCCHCGNPDCYFHND